MDSIYQKLFDRINRIYRIELPGLVTWDWLTMIVVATAGFPKSQAPKPKTLIFLCGPLCSFLEMEASVASVLKAFISVSCLLTSVSLLHLSSHC